MSGRCALLSCVRGVIASGAGVMLAAGGLVAPTPVLAANAPANVTAAPDTFLIQAYDVSGVTRLTSDEVERAVYAHVGPHRSKDDVEAARKALQDAYAAKGLDAVIVEVPVQSPAAFAQGIVDIAVNEVPVGQVVVKGSRFHSLWLARDQVPSLQEGKPVDFKALQADIANANRFPDRPVSPSFKPGLVPGTLDVDLAVDDARPYHASVQLDNDASPNTTPTRLTASARYTNLWQKGQTATFTYVVAPENRRETEVFAGSYTIPFIGTPWLLAISGYHSNSNVAALGGSDVLGKGYQVGIRAIYQLPSDKVRQSFSFGPDYKAFDQNISVAGAAVSTAPIHYIPLEVQYAISGATAHASWSLTLGSTLGLRALKYHYCIVSSTTGTCTATTEFEGRSYNASENFYRGNLNFNYSYAFDSDVIAEFRLSGQIADSPLVTNEQISAGGLSSVRGYYSAEAVGDNGIEPSLELRSPTFASHFGHWLSEARFYGFADSAFLKVLDPQGARTGYRLFGLGGGLRARILDHFSGDILVGVPLLKGPTTRAGDPRIGFQVKGDF